MLSQALAQNMLQKPKAAHWTGLCQLLFCSPMRRDQSDGQFLSSAKGKVPRKAEIQVHRNRHRGRGAFPGLGLLLGDVTIEDLLALKACESKFSFSFINIKLFHPMGRKRKKEECRLRVQVLAF